MAHAPAYGEFRRVVRLSNSVTPAASTTQLLSEYDYFRNKVSAPTNILANDASNYSGLGLQKDVLPIAYDALHRLTSANYATDGQSEAFTYDDLGNRISFTQRDATVVSYAHNAANEYEKIGTPLPSQDNVVHDDAGNLTGDEDGYGYAYDYDNKLVLIFQDTDGDGTQDPGEATLATYVRDALGRRIEYKDVGSAGPTVTTRYYHDGDNSVVEYDDKTTPGISLRRYFVHGAQYIDERAVVHDFDFGQDYYYYLDDLYTVDGLVNNRGHEVERYTYDVYGKPEITVVKIYDVNYDGTVDALDSGLVTLNFGLNPCIVGPIFDLDGSGVIDILDFDAITANFGSALATAPQSSIGNPYLFTGRTLDTIYDGTAFPAIYVVLQDNRNRSYDSEHGRWLQRDPIGYTDSMNLYEYVRSNPAGGVDPSGLKTVPCFTQGFGGPGVIPPLHDWLPNYRGFNKEFRDQGGFQVFGEHWLSRKGTNLFFRSGSSYSNWLDGTGTVKQMKLDIGDSVKKQALGNARSLLKCGKKDDTCIVENLKKPFLESPGGYFGTDWLSTGNITVLSYSVCNISKKCCVDGRNCTKTQANCHTVFVAHDSFHFGFPGKPFFWHAKLVSHYPRGTDYYGPGCKRR